jgi:hypothetical protein
MSFSNRVAIVERWLGHPRAAAIIVAVGAIAVCASLNAGLAADDLWHQLVLERSRAFAGFDRSPFDLFRFASPDWNRELMDAGVFPWWADPNVRFGFIRPLSALTHLIDHVLWPSSALMMHAQNIVWWIASVASVAVVYRRLVSPLWLANLALFLYALDDARGAPVAWVANRNALVGCAASVWTLYAFHRVRADDWRPGTWLGPLALVVGYSGSEGSIAMLGYLVAYALFLDDRPGARRAWALAPYFGITAGWFVASKALGYGVSGSGVYLDPLGDLGLFLRVLPERFAILLFAQLGGPWSEGWNAYPAMVPGLEHVVLAAAIVAIGFFGWLVAPVLRRSRSMRFWVAGTLFAIVPSCAAFPADRMLSWASIGGMGMLAELFGAAARGELRHAGLRGGLTRIGVGGLVFAHVIAAPLLISMR